MPALSVELTPKVERMLKQAMATGDFEEQTEIGRQARLAWDSMDNEQKTDRFKKRLAEGIAQAVRREFAPLLTVDELMREVELEISRESML